MRIPKIERVLEVVSMHYKLRAVSNMFLKNVVSHLNKSSEFDLSSNDEIFQFINFVSKIVPEFLQLVDNQSGLILRLNHQIPLFDVNRKIRQYLTEIDPQNLEDKTEVESAEDKAFVDSN